MTDNPERFKYTCTRVLQHVPVSKKISAAKYKSLYLMQDRIRKHAEKKDAKEDEKSEMFINSLLYLPEQLSTT